MRNLGDNKIMLHIKSFILAGSYIWTVILCSPLSAQPDTPGLSDMMDTKRSEPRLVHSTYFGADFKLLPGVFWNSPGDAEGEAEKFMLPFMQAHGDIFKGKTVLDIAAGSGIISLYAARLGAARVVATDTSTAAVANITLGAHKFKYNHVIEPRLVPLADPSAFSAIAPEEVFDIIIANPPYQVNDVDEKGRNRNNSEMLGLSILNGLERHLKPDGSVILFYRSRVMHDVMVGYAERLDYAVEHQEASIITFKEWCTLYYFFVSEIERRNALPPQTLKYPADTEDCKRRFGYAANIATLKPATLWGKKLDRDFPGLILIRNKH